MRQELNNLSQEFLRYRGRKKRVKYPKTLWDKAIKLSKHLSLKEMAIAIGVSTFTLQRHLRSEKKGTHNFPNFIPIQIREPQPTIQLHLKGPLPMTIDFSPSTEEFAKLLLAIQGGLSC